MFFIAVHRVQCYTCPMKIIEELAFAKLNLTLGILYKRQDGYHAIDTIMQTINLFDRVYIEKVLPEKMKWNLQSIEHFSVVRDLQTMFRTVLAVLGKDY